MKQKLINISNKWILNEMFMTILNDKTTTYFLMRSLQKRILNDKTTTYFVMRSLQK